MNEAVRDPDRAFFGHPRGLMYLAAMEGFERFSYYGMQALLVLYMTGRLFTPGVIDHVIGFAPFRAGLEAVLGHLSLQGLALQIFGLYGGLVFLLPVVGGYVGDQLLGRRRTIVIGLVVMAFGHLLMAFEQTFLFALLALLTGSALLKGNVSAQVGGLYAPEDSRRDQGFSIFLMSSNTGAVLSPLVCGTLGELYGWPYGFGAAFVVVLIGLVIYLVTSRHLPNDPPRHRANTVVSLDAGDGARIAMLAVLAGIASLFWVAQSQIWNAYPVWSRDRVDRHVFGFEVPVTWFQSVDSLGTIVFGPMVIWLWARQQRRGTEPGDLTKIVWGSLFFAGSEMLLAAGELAAKGGKVAVAWPLSFHILSALGWLYFAPVVLALVARISPRSMKATGIAAASFAVFVGSTVSGALGKFYGVIPTWQFWGLHAGFAMACGLAVWALMTPMNRVLAGMARTEAADVGSAPPATQTYAGSSP
jgi:POT family proton-dependent oligopeptide transporter